MRVIFAHQLVQGNFFDAQVVLGGNFLGGAQVEAGLRFARVGDGGGADLKVAFGGGQLLTHGGFLGFDEGQGVHRGQHVKVGLADPHDEVLVGGRQLGLCEVNLLFALLVGGPVGRAVQGLRGAQRGALRVVVALVGGGQGVVQVGGRGAHGQPHRGQNGRFGLVCPRQRGGVLRLG